MLIQFHGVVWLETFLCVRSLLLIRKWFIKADECSYYNPESVQVVSRHGLMGKMDGVIGDHPLVSEIPFWRLEFDFTVSALLSFRTVLKQGDSIFGCVGRNLRWAMIVRPPTTSLVIKLLLRPQPHGSDHSKLDQFGKKWTLGPISQFFY